MTEVFDDMQCQDDVELPGELVRFGVAVLDVEAILLRKRDEASLGVEPYHASGDLGETSKVLFVLAAAPADLGGAVSLISSQRAEDQATPSPGVIEYGLALRHDLMFRCNHWRASFLSGRRLPEGE